MFIGAILTKLVPGIVSFEIPYKKLEEDVPSRPDVETLGQLVADVKLWRPVCRRSTHSLWVNPTGFQEVELCQAKVGYGQSSKL